MCHLVWLCERSDDDNGPYHIQPHSTAYPRVWPLLEVGDHIITVSDKCQWRHSPHGHTTHLPVPHLGTLPSFFLLQRSTGVTLAYPLARDCAAPGIAVCYPNAATFCGRMQCKMPPCNILLPWSRLLLKQCSGCSANCCQGAVQAA